MLCAGASPAQRSVPLAGGAFRVVSPPTQPCRFSRHLTTMFMFMFMVILAHRRHQHWHGDNNSTTPAPSPTISAQTTTTVRGVYNAEKKARVSICSQPCPHLARRHRPREGHLIHPGMSRERRPCGRAFPREDVQSTGRQPRRRRETGHADAGERSELRGLPAVDCMSSVRHRATGGSEQGIVSEGGWQRRSSTTTWAGIWTQNTDGRHRLGCLFRLVEGACPPAVLL